MLFLMFFCLFFHSVYAAQAAQHSKSNIFLAHATRYIPQGGPGSGFFRSPDGNLVYVANKEAGSKSESSVEVFNLGTGKKTSFQGPLIGVARFGFMYQDVRQRIVASNGTETYTYPRLKGLRDLHPSPLLKQMIAVFNGDINPERSTYRVSLVDHAGMQVVIGADISGDPAKGPLPITISDDGAVAVVRGVCNPRGGLGMAVVDMPSGKVRTRIPYESQRVSISPDNTYAACLTDKGELGVFNLLNGNRMSVVQRYSTGDSNSLSHVDSCCWAGCERFCWTKSNLIGGAALSGNRFESSAIIFNVIDALPGIKDVVMRGSLIGESKVLLYLQARKGAELLQGAGLVDFSINNFKVQVLPAHKDSKNEVELLPGYVVWSSQDGNRQIYVVGSEDDEAVDPAVAAAAATPSPAPDANGL